MHFWKSRIHFHLPLIPPILPSNLPLILTANKFYSQSQAFNQLNSAIHYSNNSYDSASYTWFMQTMLNRLCANCQAFLMHCQFVDIYISIDMCISRYGVSFVRSQLGFLGYPKGRNIARDNCAVRK